MFLFLFFPFLDSFPFLDGPLNGHFLYIYLRNILYMHYSTQLRFPFFSPFFIYAYLCDAESLGGKVKVFFCEGRRRRGMGVGRRRHLLNQLLLKTTGWTLYILFVLGATSCCTSSWITIV
jgi:hypothetical protein